MTGQRETDQPLNDADLFGAKACAKPIKAARGASERALRNKKFRADRAAREAAEWAPDVSHKRLVDLVVNSIFAYDTYGRDRAVHLIDHLGDGGIDLNVLRSALTATPPPVRALPDDQINGNRIREVLDHLDNAEHARKMLASSLAFLIRDRLWTNYEMVSGRQRSFSTLREMLLATWPEGLDRGHDIKALREILSSFDKGLAALAVFEASFAEGSDNMAPVSPGAGEHT